MQKLRFNSFVTRVFNPCRRLTRVGNPCYALAFFVLFSPVARAADWKFKDEFLPQLVEKVPEILKSQDKSTGRFGKGVWICRDQEVMYPLAAAWCIESAKNPFFHDTQVLDAIMSGGDALIAEQT